MRPRLGARARHSGATDGCARRNRLYVGSALRHYAAQEQQVIGIRYDGAEWQRGVSTPYFISAHAARRPGAAGKHQSCNHHEEHKGNEC